MLEPGDSGYLFLPLAHAFAILIQFATFDLGATLAYWSRRRRRSSRTSRGQSDHPVGTRMFEKIHARDERRPDKAMLEKAVDVGVKVRMARRQARTCRERRAFDQAEEQLYKNVRALFGKNIRECVTGAAPIAPEILRFFYACGVPVMEGYGMTETATSATVNRPDGNRFRFKLGREADGGRRRGSPTTARC